MEPEKLDQYILTMGQLQALIAYRTQISIVASSCAGLEVWDDIHSHSIQVDQWIRKLVLDSQATKSELLENNPS